MDSEPGTPTGRDSGHDLGHDLGHQGKTPTPPSGALSRSPSGALKDFNARLREAQVMQLRLRGMGFDEIAKVAGYADRGAAHKAWKRALSRIPLQSVEEARREMAHELDELKALVAALAYGDPKAVDEKERKPSLVAVDRLIAIYDRKAKLMGLDARSEEIATQNIVRRYVGVTVEEI